MSRLKNFSRNLATSYLQLGVNVIYSLCFHSSDFTLAAEG